MPFLSLCILALGVSLDGFGVGVTYGIRKIRIPLASVAVISLCSGLVIYTAMHIGQWMSGFLSPAAASRVGALILIAIGVWAVVQTRLSKRSSPAAQEPGPQAEKPDVRRIVTLELKKLGLVIQILRTPSAADVDRSGTISAFEAVILGSALSLDAFGAGIGAALIGFAPFITAAAIALSSGVCIAMGLKAGTLVSGSKWLRRLTVLPGMILIAMGLTRLFL